MTQDRNAIIRPAKLPHHISASFMSDTKWRKLFAALDREDLKLRQLIIKFVDDNAEHLIRTPDKKDLQTPNGYVDTFRFGPIPLKDIEWIEFPAVAEYPRKSPSGTGRITSKLVQQDIAKAEIILASLGKFPMEKTARGLRIVGHTRQSGPTAKC